MAGFDLPFNQAPSLHIVLLMILWDFYRRRLHGLWKALLHLWSLLIGISVLTTYQHHFIDVPTGLLAGALCMWLWPLEGERPLWRWTAVPARRRLAGMYGSGALAVALLAGVGRPWWWLYWPAAALALVALCYAALGEGGFQKRVNGRHSVASRLLLWPYRIGAWINARWWTRRLPSSVAIDEHVWLGRVPLPWESDHARFAHIVDVTSELGLRHHGVRSHGWLDLTEPTPAQLLAAAQAVQQAAASGPVLLCCALGFSRSSAVAATWLVLYRSQASVEDAIRHLRRVRPQVVLKPPLVRTIEQTVAMASNPA